MNFNQNIDSLQKPSIFKLKKQYRRLFLINFEDKYDFIFRLLTWGELKLLRSLANYSKLFEQSILEDIFEECVVHHNVLDLDSLKAGTVPTLSKVILNLSTYGSVDELNNLLEKSRDTSSNVNNQIELVLSAGLGYKTSEINELYVDEIISELTICENILASTLPKVPLTVIEKGKIKKKNKEDIKLNTKPPIRQDVPRGGVLIENDGFGQEHIQKINQTDTSEHEFIDFDKDNAELESYLND